MTDDASPEAAGDAAGGPPAPARATPPFTVRKVPPPTAAERQARREAMERAIKFGAAPYRDAEGRARYVFFREANNAPVEAWRRDREAKRGYRRTQYARKAAGQMVWHPEDQIELGKRLGVIYYREGRSPEGAAERGLYDAIWRYEHIWDSFTVPRRYGRDIIETGRIAAVAEEEGRKLQAEDSRAQGGFWVRDRKNHGLIYVVPNPDPNAAAEEPLVDGAGEESIVGMADPAGVRRSVPDIAPEVYDPASFYDIEEDAEDGGLVIVGQADEAEGFLQLAGGRQPQTPQRRKVQQETLDQVADGFLAVLDAGSSPDDPLWQQLARVVAEILPGTGHVLSAREAYVAFNAAATAIQEGDWEEALLKGGEALLNLAGAVPALGDLLRLGKGAVKVANLLVKLLRRSKVRPQVLAMAAEGGGAGRKAGHGSEIGQDLGHRGEGGTRGSGEAGAPLPEEPPKKSGDSTGPLNAEIEVVNPAGKGPVDRAFPGAGTNLHVGRGEPVAKQVWESGVPLGFKSAEELRGFTQLARGRLASQADDVVIGIKGSAVTGRSYYPSRGDYSGPAFDGKPGGSDLDLAIISPTLLRKAQEAGIPLRGKGLRTGALNDKLLEKIGLDGILEDLSGLVGGREVTLMFYGTAEELQRRGTMMILK